MPNAPLPAEFERLATFGGGCFWCTEAIFLDLRGVHKVASGYAGGHVDRPTYQQVCNGDTGHAEVVQVTYDPRVVSYDQLLEVFFKTHDPTTRHRQGADVGSQYRSVIFFHDEAQRQTAEAVQARLDDAGVFPAPIVTEIVPFTNFFPAEESHQNYFALHGEQPYCSMVIAPKLEKFRAVFADQIRRA